MTDLFMVEFLFAFTILLFLDLPVLFLCLSVLLFIYLTVYLVTFLSKYGVHWVFLFYYLLFTYSPSIYLFIYPFNYLSLYLCNYLSIHIFIHVTIYLYVYLSIEIYMYLSSLLIIKRKNKVMLAQVL